jgi:hypothetical protein
MAPKVATDFSSPGYWSTRFQTETSFEWLSSSSALIPAMLSAAKDVASTQEGPVKALHFGCGTSSLGVELARALKEEKVEAEVTDADYVAVSIHTADVAEQDERAVPLISLDVLDPAQLAEKSPEMGWDLLLDKSTADAIACGPNVSLAGESVEPIVALCSRLARVIRIGGRWVCVSYSERRFAHLEGLGKLPNKQWRIVSRGGIPDGIAPEGKVVREDKGKERVVYEPQTNIWIYILERIVG